MKGRRGFTLVELFVVGGIIIILASALLYSSSEAVTTAHATRIINNLRVMKTAVLSWYRDNRDKVITIDTNDRKPGMLNLYNGKKQINPIQEVGDQYLHLSEYLEDLGGVDINLSKQESGSSGRTNTLLQPGCYGVCDGGTIRENGTIKEYHRDVWYVGYRFKDNEGAVREKIRARMKSTGVWLGTGDAHVDYKRSNEEAVWLKVLQL